MMLVGDETSPVGHNQEQQSISNVMMLGQHGEQ